MGGDSYVAIDPANLQTLAARMHDLATTVAAEAPKIRSLMQKWHDGSSFAQLATVQNRFGDQAVSMKQRADLAVEVANQKVSGFGAGPVVVGSDAAQARTAPVPGGMLVLPWDTSDPGYTGEAAQDAAALKKALDKGDGQKNLDEINRIAQVLADHQDDPQFLTTFYQSGGADQIYRMPDVLRSWGDDKFLGKDGGLSPQGQQILTPFADNLAAASRLVKGLGLPAKAFDSSKAGDNRTDIPSWCLAQLLSLGPAGPQWGNGYLAQVGAKALPYGESWYKIDTANSWSPSAGLGNTMMQPILQRLRESPPASLQMLAGPNGAASAKALFQGSAWFDSLGGTQIIQDALARDLAPNIAGPTSELTNDQAATNVFSGVAGIDPGDMKQITPESLRALALVADPYIPDIAKSANTTFTADGLVPQPGQGRITLILPTVKGIVAAMAADGTSTKMFTASILNATQQAVQGETPLTAKHVEDLGNLQARFLTAQQNGDIAKAQHQDDLNTDRQAWLGAALGFAGSVPIPEAWFGKLNRAEAPSQQADGAASPWLSKLFPADNEQKQEDKAQTALGSAWNSLNVPIVQGLILDGTIKPADVEGQAWCQNGIVDVTLANQDQFTNWVTNNSLVDPKTQKANALMSLTGESNTGMVHGGFVWKVG